MVFKINLSTQDGKTYKLETEAEGIIGKSLKETIKGEEVSPDLVGYELVITGASDKAGFTAMENQEGIQLRKVLLTYGKGMHKRPRREGKKPRTTFTPGGLRLRKTVRGKLISEAISQVNIKVLKEGNKKLSEIFPDQNKAPESATEQKAETPTQ